jgi:uncharacterized protein with HEPN domain
VEIQEKDQQILRTILSYIDGIHRTHVSFRNDRDAFLGNPDYQYSAAFALLQVGELTGRLEMDIPNKASIKALRNRIVHGNGSVNQARPASPKQPRVLTCPGRALSTNHSVYNKDPTVGGPLGGLAPADQGPEKCHRNAVGSLTR